jgi:hypothetical protein
MTPVLVAEFDQAERFIEAMRKLDRQGRRPVDALMPFHIPEAAEIISGGRRPPTRLIMALGGFGMAAFAYGLQWFSAAVAYPIDAGGRPFNSWPIFILAPFEVGVLAAAIAGFVSVLVGSGLPRLHHPLLAYPGIERATQDRFFILVRRAENEQTNEAATRALFDLGAISIGASEA